MVGTGCTTYDEVPYESNPFNQTHPDRLAVIGHLLGLRVASPKKCRVLEIGCAAGGNLIPMAYQLPGSQFVGIDLSKVQVDEGLETVKALGLTNIDLKQLSILDVTPALGKFDYILCHEVYSWVPNTVQKKILEIRVYSLNPQEIAYISNIAYFGWHRRGDAQEETFWTGHHYLRKHAEWLKYTNYRRQGTPIAGGVTEAACETVFAGRLKRSGITWSREGGQVILEIRLLVLSRVWPTTHQAYLASRPNREKAA